MSADRLFKPLKLGNVNLHHRVVMAPLTRFRADDTAVPAPYAKDYYSQRASEIVDSVHAKGSFIYCQLWALGRVAVAEVLKKDGYEVVSSSAVPVDPEHVAPKALTVEEIQVFINDYANAARNAMRAGFDGVEIHGANGYLPDQFWQDVVNQRTDDYGGSIEKRARFGLEVTQAVIEAVGGDSQKVAMRLSPFGNFQGMCMKEPILQFSHIVAELKKLNLSYLHLVESRISGSSVDGKYHDITRENDELVRIWGTDAPIILAGGFTPEKARKVMSEVYTADNVCIAFGRYFISTPDLPFRIENGIELNRLDRRTFYKPQSSLGYTDYPFSEEWLSRSESRL